MWRALVASAAAAMMFSGCSRTGAAKMPPAEADPPSVAVVKATVDDLTRSVILTAEFKPFQEIDVMAKVAGYVKNIYVDAGDRVKQGQLLAILEVPEMADDEARATASVERSQAEVARAKDELQRAESAHEISHLSFTRLSAVAKQKPGLIALQEIDDAHGKDLVAEAQISSAKSALAAAEQQVRVNTAEERKIKTLAEYTRVTAPFTGVITKRFADTGAMIQAGTASNTQAEPLVRLSENKLLRLILPVPESAVPTVRVGETVEVRVPTLNRSFPGRVARFADRVSTATRTMDTEVDVQNPNLVLVPGMYAEVNLTVDHRHAVVTVPMPAVDIGDLSSGQVVVVTPEHRIEMRKVQLGMQTPERIEIRAGLKEGEMVISGSRAGLEPGEQVKPVLASGS